MAIHLPTWDESHLFRMGFYSKEDPFLFLYLNWGVPFHSFIRRGFPSIYSKRDPFNCFIQRRLSSFLFEWGVPSLPFLYSKGDPFHSFTLFKGGPLPFLYLNWGFPSIPLFKGGSLPLLHSNKIGGFHSFIQIRTSFLLHLNGRSLPFLYSKGDPFQPFTLFKGGPLLFLYLNWGFPSITLFKGGVPSIPLLK